MGTKYLLGWLPLGCSIHPLGMSVDDDEKLKFKDTELPFTLFTKPRYLRIIFNLVPSLIFLAAFCISLILLSGLTNFVTEFNNILNYIINAFETMFGSDIMRIQFIDETKKLLAHKNVVLFGFILLTFIMFLVTPLTQIMTWFSDERKSKSKIQKTFGFILTICICWFMVWKLPKFIFSFFSFYQTLIYIGGFLIGMFSFGIICFYTTLFVVKNVSINLNNSKVQ